MKRFGDHISTRLCLMLSIITQVACAHSSVAQTGSDKSSGGQAGQSPIAIASTSGVPAPGKGVLTAEDEQFLDDLQRRGIQFFIDEADPETGLMPDRGKANGGGGDVASIASVGFGLTALCIGAERGWVPRQDVYDRSIRVLKFLRDKVPHAHGHFYHFLDMRTGQRVWDSEASNIDTAILMAGAITVRQLFPNTELASIVNELYQRVEWGWLVRPDGRLCMGWKPESGFIDAHWDQFNEGTLIFLMAMGSPTHPLPPEAWQSWERKPVMQYEGMTFLQCPPLFTQQFPQCWFDLRGLRDDSVDYFRNSQLATRAQREWCANELSKRFPSYSSTLWGISASDSAVGYQAWGGPPQQGAIDGSVVPCAVAGSLPFEPRLCMDALLAMRKQCGDKGYLKYGFVDAFNPATDWYNPDVIGIDVGATVVMAENCRSGFVWRKFMSSTEAVTALKAARFVHVEGDNSATLMTSIFSRAER